MKIIRFIKSRHFLLVFCFVLIASVSFAQQKGVINYGAKMIIKTGAYLKITGTDANYINETSGSLNGRIDLDGILEIEGNWSNHATSGYVFDDYLDSDGEIIFKGITQQTIGGSRATYFENLELDNANGLSLSGSVEINNILTLTNGVITLNNNNLSIGNSGMISGIFGPSNMIITNGTGSLRKAFASPGTFSFPIGDNTSNAEYSPVDINLKSGDISSAWIGAKVTDTQHPNDNSVEEYLTRYWTLSSSGIINPVYDADFNYLDSDIFGAETEIYSAGFDGPARTLYSKVSAATNLISITGLSAFNNYTGVDGTSPAVTISSTETGPTAANPIPVTIEFTEQVTGFVVEDITVLNGVVDNLVTQDNIIFTVDIIPDAKGEVLIDIASGVVTDMAGNLNIAAEQFNIEYDETVGFNELLTNNVAIYSIDNYVIVEFPDYDNYHFKNGQIEIYNSIGQKILSKKINNYAKSRIQVNEVSGIYIVNVIIDGKLLTKKLYIK